MAIILLYLLIPIYYFFEVNSKRRTGKYVKALNILFIMFSVYGILLIIGGENVTSFKMENVNRSTYLLKICSSLLPFYAFYTFTLNGSLTEKNARLWCFVIFGVATFAYYHNQMVLLEEAMTGIHTRDEVTNNFGYIVVALIPLTALYIKKPLIHYTLIAYCLLFVLMSMKRGAIIVGFLCVAYSIFLL